MAAARLDRHSLEVRRLAGTDSDQARALVATHFGPDWAERFLGMAALATLNLVGRAGQLDDVIEFVDSPEQQLYVLGGVGGGESRLAVAVVVAAVLDRCPTWLR